MLALFKKGTRVRTTKAIDGRIAGQDYIPVGAVGVVKIRHRDGNVSVELEEYGLRYLTTNGVSGLEPILTPPDGT